MNNPNTFIFTVALILSINGGLGQTGLYLTANDFANKKLSYTTEKIKIHKLFKNDIVELKSNDSLIKLKKTEVFGYTESGEVFRFFENKSLQILNRDEPILIYKYISGTGLKNSPLTEIYYFSKSVQAPVQELNLINIEAAFSENPFFVTLVEIYFKDNKELIEFDHVHNKYKLNRLMAISVVGKS